MKKFSDITNEEVNRIKLIMFDCDGVTIPLGTKVVEVESYEGTVLTVKSPKMTKEMLEKLTELKEHFLIGFSSGRNMTFLMNLYRDILDERVILQAENGLFTLIDGTVVQNTNDFHLYIKEFREMQQKVRNIKHKNITGYEPKQFIITVHVLDRVQEIENLVAENKNFYCVYHKNEAYDIGVKKFDKGYGLRKLQEMLNLEKSEVLAVGNGGNDKPMLDVAVGVTVDKDNIQSDYFTRKKMQAGALEVINKLLEIKKSS